MAKITSPCDMLHSIPLRSLHRTLSPIHRIPHLGVILILQKCPSKSPKPPRTPCVSVLPALAQLTTVHPKWTLQNPQSMICSNPWNAHPRHSRASHHHLSVAEAAIHPPSHAQSSSTCRRVATSLPMCPTGDENLQSGFKQKPTCARPKDSDPLAHPKSWPTLTLGRS